MKVAGLLSFSGPYDFEVALKSKIPFGFSRDIGNSFLGMKLKKDFSNFKDYPFINEVSPINYVNEKWCPCFLSYSEKDIFCKGQGEVMQDKLKAVNVPVYSHNTIKVLDNHCYHLDFYKSVSKECIGKVEKFLESIKNAE